MSRLAWIPLEYDRQSKAAAEFAAFFTEVLEVSPDA
jgi:hypothetical protein